MNSPIPHVFRGGNIKGIGEVDTKLEWRLLFFVGERVLLSGWHVRLMRP